MFHLMKPGHILRFGTCPSTIVSPKGAILAGNNDNTLETAWPTISNLGLVECLSHASGNIGPIAADVATRLRTTPGSVARTVSYSAPGRLMTASNRQVGSENCAFVGYVDGQSNYIQSAQTVFSKDFSGCLMVAYTTAGQRRVAHVAASAVPEMNCKQAFLTTIQNQGAVLAGGGWFRPFVSALHSGRKGNAFAVVGLYMAQQINNLTTFGVVTNGNQAYSIDAFKPAGIGGNDWVITDITAHQLTVNWVAP